MTVICAYTDGNLTWIGSDTCGIVAGSFPMEVGKKWHGAHGWAFGHCGDAYVANLFEVQANLLFKELQEPSVFVERVRKMYEHAGLKAVFRDGEACGSWENSGILVRAGAIWNIDGNLAVTPVPAYRLFARGCAWIEAMAAASGAQRTAARWVKCVLPNELIDVALECAAEFDVNIRGKWQDFLRPELTVASA